MKPYGKSSESEACCGVHAHFQMLAEQAEGWRTVENLSQQAWRPNMREQVHHNAERSRLRKEAGQKLPLQASGDRYLHAWSSRALDVMRGIAGAAPLLLAAAVRGSAPSSVHGVSGMGIAACSRDWGAQHTESCRAHSA